MFNQVTSFSFWCPITFTPLQKLDTENAQAAGRFSNQNPGKTSLEKFAWNFGSLMDQFIYVGKKNLQIHATPLNTSREISCKIDQVKSLPMWQTALKISAFALGFFLAPKISLLIATTALITKIIFKLYLMHNATFVNSLPPSVDFTPNTLIASKQIGKTTIALYEGSIINQIVDAVVNPANRTLAHLSGVCGLLHNTAGGNLIKECEEILTTRETLTNPQKPTTIKPTKIKRNIDCGEAVLTSACNLSPGIKVIVHAAGPDCHNQWQNAHKEELLIQAYQNSLKLVTKPQNIETHISTAAQQVALPVSSVAFPSISTGLFGYPIPEAAKTALEAVKDFIEKNPDSGLEEIRFVFLPLEKDAQKTSLPYKKALEQL